MSESHYLLSVDPGKISGWAIFKLPHLLIAYGQLKMDKSEPWVEFWDYHCHYDGDWRIICESQFIPNIPFSVSKSQKLELFSKQQKALKIANSAGMWEGMAQYLGWEIMDQVHPNTWRSAIFGKRKMTVDQAKKMSVELVNHTYELALKKYQHHTAEGICIGMYAKQQILTGI